MCTDNTELLHLRISQLHLLQVTCYWDFRHFRQNRGLTAFFDGALPGCIGEMMTAHCRKISQRCYLFSFGRYQRLALHTLASCAHTKYYSVRFLTTPADRVGGSATAKPGLPDRFRRSGCAVMYTAARKPSFSRQSRWTLVPVLQEYSMKATVSAGMPTAPYFRSARGESAMVVPA